jgi:hypothetical protein
MHTILVTCTYDSANESNSGYRVIFHDSGFLYIERMSRERFYITEENEIDPATTVLSPSNS